LGRTWISQYKNYRIVNAVLVKTQLTTAGPMVSEPGYDIEFSRSRMLEPWEYEFAKQTWPKIRGTKHHGYVTPGDPEPTIMGNIDPIIDRFSVFDLEMAPEWAREQAEYCLDNHALNGTDFVEVQRPKLKAPWKSYDTIRTGQGRSTSWVAEQIVQRVEEIGLDPAEVAHYEKLTDNRDYVLQALEGLSVPDEDAIEVTA